MSEKKPKPVCTLKQTQLRFIPPDGALVKCPVHGEHRIYGAQIHFR